ncbi:hypothetical protein [Pseudoalteromonas sp. ASV78]|uniref:hypothetical protein n=1 Tax=Pseudoalteromonas sp. ASV78 TaxID=3397851 RepID=UPI0039FDB119
MSQAQKFFGFLTTQEKIRTQHQYCTLKDFSISQYDAEIVLALLLVHFRLGHSFQITVNIFHLDLLFHLFTIVHQAFMKVISFVLVVACQPVKAVPPFFPSDL